MKTYFLPIITVLLFCCGTCSDDSTKQSLIIHNNSGKEIIVDFSMHSSIEKDTTCFKLPTDFEYRSFIKQRSIESFSNKNFEAVAKGILNRPDDTLSIGAFYRADMDNMTCEEFKQKYPIKKVWKVTKADMDSMNWELSYP